MAKVRKTPLSITQNVVAVPLGLKELNEQLQESLTPAEMPTLLETSRLLVRRMLQAANNTHQDVTSTSTADGIVAGANASSFNGELIHILECVRTINNLEKESK